MYFETLQSISLNGRPDKPNDDRCGSSAQMAWVVDGATDMGEPGLLGTQGGAAWLASTASTSFAMANTDHIQKTCQTVFERIEEQFNLQKTRDVSAPWEIPKAAFGAAQLAQGKLSVAWAADCSILQISGDDVHWCTGEPDTSAEAADAVALGAGVGAAEEFSGAVLENRRAHRARENHVALSTNANASAKITRFADTSVRVGDEILLMSDGFASLVTDYRKYSAQSLAKAMRSKGLGQLAHEIRMIEEEDAECLRYPRFKVSDDATAIWLRVLG